MQPTPALAKLKPSLPESAEMEPMECQYHPNCGGWCETDEEREKCLCGDCLTAEREEEAERQYAAELGKAMQRIAVAAGIELVNPREVADIVCARLKLPNDGVQQRAR